MKSCIEKGEKRYKQLQGRLVRVKEEYESQLNEVKLVYDHRVSALDKEFTKREQVSYMSALLRWSLCLSEIGSSIFK